MNGHIIQLIDDQQFGTLAGEDGIDYVFHSRSLIGVTFGGLQIGVPVTFTPIPATKRAKEVTLWSAKTSAAPNVERER